MDWHQHVNKARLCVRSPLVIAMPINSLESFLFERKLVSVSPVEILQNATLGIDVEHYLGRIYTYKKEQLLLGIGGIPVSLKAYIESDLAVFREFNIRPLFVFPGLHIQKSDSLTTNDLTEAEKHREITWTRLHTKWSSPSSNPSVHLNESFRLHSDLISPRPMTNDLIKYFIEYDIDFIVCPSDPSHQLSYMFHNGIIDCIYGSTDLLLTQIDKFILGMEFLSKDFRFVDKHKVLNELNLTESQLIDISIIVGCSSQPVTFSTLPPMPKHNPASQFQQMTHFKYVLDLMYQYKTFQNESSLYSYVAAFNDDDLMDLYCKGLAAIKYMPVMNLDGEVKLYISEIEAGRLSDELSVFQTDVKDEQDPEQDPALPIGLKIPSEVHDVVSQRLPSELYYYLSVGLMPSKVLEAIALNHLDIRPPLEGGRCEDYKKLVSSRLATQVLDAQFNLVTQLLARYYQVKRIPVSLWFTEEMFDLNSRMSMSMSARLSSWSLSKESKSFSLKTFSSKCPLLEEKSKNGEDRDDNIDIVSTSVLRGLVLLNSGEVGHNLASFLIEVSKELILKYPEMEDHFIEEIFVLLILVKLKIFDFFSTELKYQGVANIFKFGDQAFSQLREEQKLHISIISRVFSLQKLSINPINYQGPISRSLLSFRSHHLFVRELIGDSIRICLVDVLTRHKTLKFQFENRRLWYSIVDQLPFFKDANNTLLGVMCEIYLDGCFKLLEQACEDSEGRQRSFDHLVSNVMQQSNPTFNINLASSNSVSSDQMIHDLKIGSRFWRYFSAAMRIGQGIDETFLESASLKTITDCDEIVARYIEGLE